jgi:hypothetical protein
LRTGDRVLIRGKRATFVKPWGSAGAVVRYDDLPTEPKVVPLARVVHGDDGVEGRAFGRAPG